jgi:hypothetical protein
MILSPTELEELTLKTTPGRQRRVLLHLGVKFLERIDKSLIVLRADVLQAYDVVSRREPQLRP